MRWFLAVLLAAVGAWGLALPARLLAAPTLPAPALSPLPALAAPHTAYYPPATEPITREAGPGRYAGTYAAVLPAADSPGRVMTLTLYPGGTVRWVTDYGKGTPILELGRWEANPDGTVTVRIHGQEGREYEQTVAIVFRLDGNRLVSTQWDKGLYGTAGVRFTRVR
jgi:hypothetical protein